MDKLTKEQAAELLCQPNGSEALARDAERAFPAAYELFIEGSPAACSFLCRAAKRREYRERLNTLLEPGREALHSAISAPSPKLRRNAARLAGELGCAEADTPPLITALACEEQRFVRPSQLLALGALGGDAAYAALCAHSVAPAAAESEMRHAEDEATALKTALASFSKFESHEFTGLSREYEIELTAPDKLSGSLAHELSQLGFSNLFSKSDRVRLRTYDIQALYGARSFFEVLFVVGKGMGLNNLPGRARTFMEEFLPAAHSGKPPFAYRIELRGEVSDRAAFIRELAAELDSGLLVNSPSAYEAELRVELSPAGSADVFLKLFTVPDERFAYRVESLPASIHPATAAAVLRHASAYLKSGARVLDPCCGSGTFLFERERITPVSALTGVDIAHKAIAIARKNALAGESRAKFIINDCRRFTANRPYDEVIANLPFGNRVGTHRDNERLYAALIKKLPEWLVPGGTALLYTMEFTLLKKLLRSAPGLTLVSEARTDAGGLMPAIFILKNGAST